MKKCAVRISIATSVCVFIGVFLTSPAFSEPQENQGTELKKSCPTRVWNGDVEINSNEALKALSGYTKIIGNVTISCSSLADLRCLYQVEGDLSIRPSGDPASLDGLNNLRFVDGKLNIDGTNVENLNGLNNLKRVGELSVFGDTFMGDALTSMSGLENLEIIQGNLTLLDYNGLRNFEGLNNLKTIGGEISIDEGYLENFKGLDNLESLGGISITNDGSLDSFEGLEKIETIEGLYLGCVIGTAHVNNFNGLQNLQYITRKLSICADYAVSLEGLENLIYVGGNFEFDGGTKVCLSEVEALRDQIINADGINGDIVEIEGNPDC